MILNAFTRKDRRNWYVQFTDPETGRRRVLVTAVRKGEPDAELKLGKIKIALMEQYARKNRSSVEQKNDGWMWVPAWISERYQTKRPSLIKHRNQWNYLFAFFNQNQIHSPLAVRRDHALLYVAWRCAQLKEKSKRGAGRNTALADLRWAGSLLREAMAREAIATNPWERLGFERGDVSIRPEFSDGEIARIRQELERRPDWMRISFEIALHTGVRFAETRIALRNVNFQNRSMLIEAPKGRGNRAYSIPIPTALTGLLEGLHRERRTHTWTLPGAGKRVLSGLEWSKLFAELNLGEGYCFHCTRVTYVSRGARAGVPEHVMMKLVNHASSEVHQIYRRVTVQDVAKFVDLVPIPFSSHAMPGTPGKLSGPPAKASPASGNHVRHRTRSRKPDKAHSG